MPNPPDDFRQLCRLLLSTYEAAELARALDVAPQTFKQMRADPSTTGHRRPPADWQDRLRPFAERLASDLRPFLAPPVVAPTEDTPDA